MRCASDVAAPRPAAPHGRRLGEGGNGHDGSIHVLLEGKNILSLLGGEGFRNGMWQRLSVKAHAPPSIVVTRHTLAIWNDGFW